MMMLMGLRAPARRRGLAGWADTIFGEGTTETEDPNTIQYEDIAAAEQAQASSGDFDWACVNPFGAGCVPSPSAPAVTPPSPSTPTNYVGILTNALNAINTGFFPKPAVSPGVVVTTPVYVAPKPWYKTPVGMGAIALGALGAFAYYNKTKKVA